MRAIESLCVLAVALLVSACNVVAVVPMVPIAPRGVHVRADVAYGYEAYADTLSPWGAWEPDAENGVRWCPNEDAIEPGFTPYTSRGHWGLSEAPIGRAPAGSVAWVSEDSDTWGAITTRHGWWVHGRQWCWIPGAEETPGRVVWRWGDGFVGWAPEAPACVAYDDVEYEALDWVFTLLGTLLDKNPEQNRLDGDARQTAQQATAPARAPGGGPTRAPRTGPPAKSIGDARQALDHYAATHAVTLQQAAHLAAAQKGSSGSSGSSSSDSSSSKSSSSSKQKKSDSGFTAGAYYEALRADPIMMDDSMVLLPRMAAAGGPRGGNPMAAGSSPRAVGSNASALSHHARSGSSGASDARIAAPSAAHASAGAAPAYRSSSGSSSKSSSKGSHGSRSSSRSSSRSKR